MDWSLFLSTLVLSALLPVSIASLMALLARHQPLSPQAHEDFAIRERFTSEEALEAYEAEVHATRVRQLAGAISSYAVRMRAALAAGDPRRAPPYMAALRRSEEPFVAPASRPAGQAPDAAAPLAPAQPPTQ